MKIPDFTRLNQYEKTEYKIRKNYPEFYNYIQANYPTDIKFNEKIWWYLHNIHTYPICPICGKRLKFKDGYSGYGKYCSLKCTGKSENAKNQRKITCKEKYGNENYHNIEQTKQTNLDKYGVENVSQSKIIQEKRKQTNLRRYGVACTLHDPSIQQKVIKTNLEKYKVKYPVSIKTSQIIDKTRNTFRSNFLNNKDNIIKYDNEGNWIMNCPHPKCNKCKEKTYIIDSGHYNDRLKNHTELCTKLLPYDNHRSKNTSLEIFIKNILDEYNIEYKTNVRNIIPPKELDIYIPSKKIAIECNGLYWHCDKPGSYHINKFKACQEQGIQLLTIWEDQIVNTPGIIKSIIITKLGLCDTHIGARKCIIKELSSPITTEFLNNNHIQGKTNSTIKLGLYYNNELVSVMTFSKRNKCSGNIKSIDGYWDLSRFCNKKNLSVVGGASKLLKYFIKKYNPIQIISFASNDISNGKLYETLGFKKDGTITQAYWYINKKDLKRYHRTSFTKSRLKQLGFDIENKTETEIMKELPFYKIYDSGHIKYILNLAETKE